MKIKPIDTWFLYDNEGFNNRKLLFAICPKCNKAIAQLIETRKSDKKEFVQVIIGNQNVDKLLKLNRQSINYKSSTTPIYKGKNIKYPKDIRYGLNKIIKKGKSKYKLEIAVSFNGNQEILQQTSINN